MDDRTFPVEHATGDDVCPICGEPLRTDDVVVDVYGDLYHVSCLEEGMVVEEVEADDDAPTR
jgi:hypothetical protein